MQQKDAHPIAVFYLWVISDVYLSTFMPDTGKKNGHHLRDARSLF